MIYEELVDIAVESIVNWCDKAQAETCREKIKTWKRKALRKTFARNKS